MVREVEVENADQHQEASDDGVEDELHSGVDAPRAAPDSDQEVHRDQHDFPEHVEENQVERGEDTDHPRLEDEEQRHVGLHLLRDGREGGEDRDGREQGRQEDEEHAHAVDAEVVLDAEARHPRRLLHELHAALSRVEHGEERQRGDEGQDRHEERDPADHPHLRRRDEQEEERSHGRQERDQRKERNP